LIVLIPEAIAREKQLKIEKENGKLHLLTSKMQIGKTG